MQIKIYNKENAIYIMLIINANKPHITKHKNK